MLFHEACAFIQAEYETHHYPWGNYDALALQGIHHRGGDDAMNIARLLRHLLEKFGQNVLRDSQ